MKPSTRIFLLILFVIIPVLNVSAQTTPDDQQCIKTLCSCDEDPAPAGMMISHVHPKKEWMIAYRYMRMNMDGLSNKGTDAGTDLIQPYQAVPQNMRMQMQMLMLMYGLSERLTVMGMFAYNKTDMSMMMPFGDEIHSHHMGSSGIADTKISFLYELLNKSHTELLVFGGLSVPTGSIRMKGNRSSMMYPGERLPYNMQNGSGVADLNAGFNYLYRLGDLNLCAQSSAIIRTYDNMLAYRPGNEFYQNIWAAWQWRNKISNSIRCEAGFSQGVKGSDYSLYQFTEPSANTANYGGTKIFAFAGMNVGFNHEKLRRHQIGFEFGLPVMQRMNGLQMKSTNNFYFNWAIKI